MINLVLVLLSSLPTIAEKPEVKEYDLYVDRVVINTEVYKYTTRDKFGKPITSSSRHNSVSLWNYKIVDIGFGGFIMIHKKVSYYTAVSIENITRTNHGWCITIMSYGDSKLNIITKDLFRSITFEKTFTDFLLDSAVIIY